VPDEVASAVDAAIQATAAVYPGQFRIQNFGMRAAEDATNSPDTIIVEVRPGGFDYSVRVMANDQIAGNTTTSQIVTYFADQLLSARARGGILPSDIETDDTSGE
jgi:hypothetical protein